MDDAGNDFRQGTIHICVPGTPEYETAVYHYFGNGIRDVTALVLEPGSESDLRAIMEVIAAKKYPFAVKNGGHISIPKILPPQGILISMNQFKNIKYHKEKKTLDVGSGVTWREVYDHFEKATSGQGLGVVGGDPLVGVSGWLLGGGYSLLTNKYGLGMDNIVGFQVHVPGARDLRNANPQENPDLFKALKGGAHNFGVVTQFTLQAYDDARRRDHIFTYKFNQEYSSLIKDAMLLFIQSGAPPEAVALMVFRHDLKDGEPESYVGVAFWYYGISPLDPFSEFREIARTSGSRDLVPFFFGGSDQMSLQDVYEAFALRHLPVSLEALQSDSDFVCLNASYEIAGNILKAGDLIERKFFKSIEDGREVDPNSFTLFKAGNREVVMASPPDPRGRMASLSVTGFTRKLLDNTEKQAKELASMMKAHNGRRASFEIWPFHKDSFNGIKQQDSAWPHEEGKVFYPLIGWFEWSGRDNDDFWRAAIKKALSELHGVAVSEGCATDDLPIYLNIALEDTSVKHIYRDNYEELKGLRQKYDPDDIMGQAVGFII